VRSGFHDLPAATLRAMADALRRGRLQPPVTSAALAKLGIGEPSRELVSEVEAGLAGGVGAAGLAWGIERLLTEREIQGGAARPELVWTGPETAGAGSRDTAVVVQELFRSAERSVLVASFAVHQGAGVFSVLAERMKAVPDLSVRLFLNVARPPGCPTNVSEARLVRDFAERFAAQDWPSGVRLPELFYDPRALSPEPGPRASLHAKCIVVDDSRAFVTSANFTEAAQERNIECGVLVNDPHFGRALRDQFESLVTTGGLKRVPRTHAIDQDES
jgi:phosphatidylserine/phosphatidylglycerophosphate/cardiolipin synthase-like enzyme